VVHTTTAAIPEQHPFDYHSTLEKQRLAADDDEWHVVGSR
jgi:hypothetical protein